MVYSFPIEPFEVRKHMRLASGEAQIKQWIIKTLFGDLKQHLGILNHQGIKLCASEKHVAEASLSVMVLDHLRTNSGLSPGETRMIIQRLVFIKAG